MPGVGPSCVFPYHIAGKFGWELNLAVLIVFLQASIVQRETSSPLDRNHRSSILLCLEDKFINDNSAIIMMIVFWYYANLP